MYIDARKDIFFFEKLQNLKCVQILKKLGHHSSRRQKSRKSKKHFSYQKKKFDKILQPKS